MKNIFSKAKSTLKALDSPLEFNAKSTPRKTSVTQDSRPSAISPPTPLDIFRYRYHHGINLNSIFVLEKLRFGWMIPPEAQGGSELDVMTASIQTIGIEATRTKWDNHWRNEFTDADLEWLVKEAKCTSIRLPIRYFTLGQRFSAGTPFEGMQDVDVDAWQAVKRLVARAWLWGIGVLLDLHALPGAVWDATGVNECERTVFARGPINPIVVGTRIYFTSSEKDRRQSPQQIIEWMPGEFGELQGKVGSVSDRGEAQVSVGEWSCILDGKTWDKVGSEEKDGLVKRFGQVQGRNWHEKSGGHYLWTYQMDWTDGREWGFAEQTKKSNIAPPTHPQLGFLDVIAFFTMRSDGTLGNETILGGHRIGYSGIWVKKRLLESGHGGEFAWEYEQGVRKGVADFEQALGMYLHIDTPIFHQYRSHQSLRSGLHGVSDTRGVGQPKTTQIVFPTCAAEGASPINLSSVTNNLLSQKKRAHLETMILQGIHVPMITLFATITPKGPENITSASVRAQQTDGTRQAPMTVILSDELHLL
ncbi:glycoside hydrolase superfamily [Calycina marina]|uniref:Glycoside hydrolase superfamily n=1 Tax=Calycina marina TaxID=1763456 RepID=A0A9P8CIW4_9HELO|nr:glycoside hydrolase superfamily [Calycina marina]